MIITGNLTRDPELRALPSGTNVCELRVACNGRRKNSEGNWEDDPNYFNVTVWGQQGENCKRYLSKGRGVAIGDVCAGVNGRPTDKSAKRSISSLRPCSSSAVAATLRAVTGMASPAALALLRVTSRWIPRTLSHDPRGTSGVADDDIPF